MTEEERNARAFVALRLEAFGPDGPMLSVIVDGRPVSWKRAKTRGTRRYTDPAMDAHANKIAATLLMAAKRRGLKALPLSVSLSIVAVWARPVVVPPGHLLRGLADGRQLRPLVPDVDNVAKLVMDAIGRTGLWADDQQVTMLMVTKVWGAVGEKSRTEIQIGEHICG